MNEPSPDPHGNCERYRSDAGDWCHDHDCPIPAAP